MDSCKRAHDCRRAPIDASFFGDVLVVVTDGVELAEAEAAAGLGLLHQLVDQLLDLPGLFDIFQFNDSLLYTADDLLLLSVQDFHRFPSFLL